MFQSLRKYSLGGIIYLCCCKLYTFLFYNKSRLIRFPIDVRNKKAITFGNRLTTGKHCRIEAGDSEKSEIKMFFGNNIHMNDFVHISAWKSVYIGDNVLIASRVYISDVSHGIFTDDVKYVLDLPPADQPLSCKPVRIENNVWIGENVCVLPGVCIGQCSVIGAGSVVTKSIPPYSIAVGVPARIIKRYCFDSCTWRKTDSLGLFLE